MSRLLFVHAHPDDESLTCAITMAHHVAAGDEVHTLTCTLGEEGEVVPAELAHLEGAAGDPLGPWRRRELREAMRRLGVHDHVLGEDPDRGVLSRYRDSGMAGTAAAAHPRAFASADLGEASALVAEQVCAIAPDIVVTYDATGGYGHPDHIKTHRVTLAALARLPDHERPGAAYEIVTPRAWVTEDRAWLRAHVPPQLGLELLGDDAPLLQSVLADDADVELHVVEDTARLPDQRRALEAHRTQLRVWDGFYALSNDVAARLAGREAFVRLDPATGERLGAGGRTVVAGLVDPAAAR